MKLMTAFFGVVFISLTAIAKEGFNIQSPDQKLAKA